MQEEEDGQILWAPEVCELVSSRELLQEKRKNIFHSIFYSSGKSHVFVVCFRGVLVRVRVTGWME